MSVGIREGKGGANRRTGEDGRARFIPASSPLSVAGKPGKLLWWEYKEGRNYTSVNER
jgi:hypothetical protein